MIVVVDTGPVIALDNLNRLDLLSLFEAPIVIPSHVRRELLSKPETETQNIERALANRIHVRDVPALDAVTKDAVARLDAGERQAVGLASALDEKTLLVMDDKAGRRVARQLDCSVTGVIGVLLRAKELGRVEAVAPLLLALREGGYWLSDAIIEHAKELAGETGFADEDDAVDDL